jgi:hypothetical protein
MLCVAVFVGLCLAVALKGAPKPVASVAAIAAPRPASPATPPTGKLVVHEWGTFTGFAGSDGVHLPFKTTAGSELPPFVMNRLKHVEKLNPNSALLAGLVFLKGDGAPALQRMETPVMYFYTDSPMDADVRVDFPGGLLTEFYPPVRSIGPRFGAASGEINIPDPGPSAPAMPTTLPTPAGPFAESFLDWGRVRIIPHPTGDEGKFVPVVTNTTHYQFARDTDSSLVQFVDAKGERHEEKFLFYRGLGNFKLPVTVAARGGDRFQIHNAGTAPLEWAYLIRIGSDSHTPTRFARYQDLAGNRELVLPPESSSDLAAAITKSLVGSGLLENEARAMVQTWKASWLDEPGTRVLYMVPRPVTDTLLPLHVQPVPEQTVRVLVGRIDVLTPEMESRLRTMMLAADANTNLPDGDVQLLSGLGRFLTPALERASRLGGESTRGQADRLRDAFSRSLANKQSR